MVFFARIAPPFTESEVGFLITLLQHGSERVFTLISKIRFRSFHQPLFRSSDAVYVLKGIFHSYNDIITPVAINEATKILCRYCSDSVMPGEYQSEISGCIQSLLEHQFLNFPSQSTENHSAFLRLFICLVIYLTEDDRVNMLHWIDGRNTSILSSISNFRSQSDYAYGTHVGSVLDWYSITP
jgi:hypothetical protein